MTSEYLLLFFVQFCVSKFLSHPTDKKQGANQGGNMELSSDLIVGNNIELCFTYSLENLKNSQYIHRMETNESFKKKQVFY